MPINAWEKEVTNSVNATRMVLEKIIRWMERLEARIVKLENLKA